jgi:hypothetical protein
MLVILLRGSSHPQFRGILALKDLGTHDQQELKCPAFREL